MHRRILGLGVGALLAASPVWAEGRDRAILPSECNRLLLYLAHLQEGALQAVDSTRLGFNLRVQGRGYDPLADLVTRIRDEEVQEAFLAYLGQAADPPEGRDTLVDRLRDWLLDSTLVQLDRNPTELADHLTEAQAHEVEALRSRLTRVGQMVYESDAYRDALLAVLNHLEPEQALQLLRSLFKDPSNPRSRDMKYNVNLLRVLGEVGVLDSDIRAISQEMKRGRGGKAPAPDRQHKIFKERLQWLIALRMANGAGIRSLVQEGALLEPSTKGAIFEHFLKLTLGKSLLRDNIGRLSIRLQGQKDQPSMALAGEYYNEETLLSDMLLDRKEGWVVVEAKAVEGLFGEKQRRQVHNYAQLIRHQIVVGEFGAFNSIGEYQSHEAQRLNSAESKGSSRRSVKESRMPPKTIHEVVYVFSNRKAAEDNRTGIAELLTLPDASAGTGKRWRIYYVDIDTGRLNEVL